MTVVDDENSQGGRPLETVLGGVGDVVRDRRRARGITLSELADKSGISVSMLSAVERGATSPSVGTLYALATALDLSLAALFARKETQAVFPLQEQQVVTTSGGSVRRLAIDAVDPAVEVFVDRYESGAAHSEAPSTHPGQEFGIVIEGELTVDLAGVPHVLRAGDAIRYDASRPHHIRNDHEQTGVAVWINFRRDDS